MISVGLKAQDQFTATYKISFNDEFDRGRKDRAFRGVLHMASGLSKYYMLPEEAFQPVDNNDSRFTPDTAQMVYTNQAEGVLIAEEFGLDGRSFFISDSLYPMVWEITAEEKQLESLSCIKALCRFRGRNYVAWFAPDIPVPYGPWKMGGLPGLIVDLQDTEENLVIRLDSFQATSLQVSQPLNIRYTVEEHFRQLKTLVQKLQASGRVDPTGNCLTCTGHSTYQFYFWEKLPQ